MNNTDTAEEKGYYAGKKVSGIKLHIVLDILGLPHAIHVTCANVTDRQGAIDMVSSHRDKLSYEVLPKRLIVERIFAWLEKYRRPCKNCERKWNISLNMTILAFIALLLRRY